MASLNKVFLMGNLTRDPELRYTANGTSLASFGLAVNRRFKQAEEWKEEVCFVDVTVWGKQAESCSEYLSKGRGVLVEGRLRYRSWETEEGQRKNKIEVVATNVQFLPRSSNQSTQEEHTAMPQSVSNEGSLDDVPF